MKETQEIPLYAQIIKDMWNKGYHPEKIAKSLNNKKLLTPTGKKFTTQSIYWFYKKITNNPIYSQKGHIQKDTNLSYFYYLDRPESDMYKCFEKLFKLYSEGRSWEFICNKLNNLGFKTITGKLFTPVTAAGLHYKIKDSFQDYKIKTLKKTEQLELEINENPIVKEPGQPDITININDIKEKYNRADQFLNKILSFNPEQLGFKKVDFIPYKPSYLPNNIAYQAHYTGYFKNWACSCLKVADGYWDFYKWSVATENSIVLYKLQFLNVPNNEFARDLLKNWHVFE
jgi:hypothetical protein